MNEIIRKRKSVRKYDLTPLDASVLDKVRAQIEKVAPLFPDIRFCAEIANNVKGIFNVKAPHYLIFGSEEKDGAFENIGFIGQQLDLFFSESGLGSCWLGMAKPEEKTASALPHVISMSFGNPAEPLYRELSEFKRKPLSEISDGTDDRLEAARLAPSAMNAQNWYFAAENGEIRCFRKKTKSVLGFIYTKMHSVDMGIALCHIAKESKDFYFIKEENVSERKGYVYTGTVKNSAT
ncbi:MAG: nitroreductase [Oscillospiraceae bacterium]|nr:nitroreductase [Oscillospiraceae bacterium]